MAICQDLASFKVGIMRHIIVAKLVFGYTVELKGHNLGCAY